MSKRPSFGSQFERLKSLGVGRPLDERKQAADERVSSVAPEGALTSIASILEESLSKANSGENSRSSTQTVSVADSGQREQREMATPSSVTVSRPESVQDNVCEKRTVSAVDTVPEGFTKVPHSLLRGDGKFSEPLDFMVYLHLFTYSHGFGRRDAHMSQAQLERFTGAAKNTVKRSLERLASQGWIKCIEEYECARMSRKWRVLSPEDRSGKPGSGGKRTGSKTNSVQNEPSPPQTGSLSGVDTQTVSKIEPFLESIPKEKTKNSLSQPVVDLHVYLATVKPAGKRESEKRAYQGLRNDYSEEQVAACLDRLVKRGVPGTGVPCHSPMGFLSKAMGQVLGEVQVELEKRAQGEARARAEAEAVSLKQVEEEEAERDSRKRELAFAQVFSTAEQQAELVGRFAGQFPVFDRNGPLVRSLAISAWWSEQEKRVV